jgi:hypothetical protein
MMVDVAAQNSSVSRRDLRQRVDSQPQSTQHRAKLSTARDAQYRASSCANNQNQDRYDTSRKS